MNREQWYASTNLQTMLEFLKDDLRPRKFRLFACACLRQLRDRTDDVHFRRTVLLAERFVDGCCDRDTFRAAFRRAWPNGWERSRVAALVAIDPLQRDMYYWRCLELANEVVDVISGKWRTGWGFASPNRDREPSRQEQISLLREAVGDPFTPVTFDARWRTGDVRPLSEAIAAESTFEDLPVLADALEDAGCAEPALLTHLRAPASHALGCWALDLVRSVD